MTQALALKRLLENAGHTVVAVFMGENPERPVPGFVRESLGDLLITFASPNFVLDGKGKGIRPWTSLLQTFPRVPRFMEAALLVHQRIEVEKPDLLVNFYDLLGGLYSSLYRPGIPVVAVAHQFLFFHPELPVVRDRWWEIQGVKWNTHLTAMGAELRLALSFMSLKDIPERRIKVVPPLLRKTILDALPTRGRHILTYVLNPGYAEELDLWQQDHPEVELHCFWDRTDVPEEISPRPGLTFHRLSDGKFVELLASSRGYASTAGFESVCEAAFLGKPVMVVPTGNHVEQRCNALDAEKAGIALWRDAFDLTDFVAGVDAFDTETRADFQRWVRGAGETILPLLEITAAGGDPWAPSLPQRPRPIQASEHPSDSPGV